MFHYIFSLNNVPFLIQASSVVNEHYVCFTCVDGKDDDSYPLVVAHHLPILFNVCPNGTFS